MAATTHSDFHADTEALEVAQAFAAGVRAKTIMVTGVNRNGIGFTTSRAFVSAKDTASSSPSQVNP